MSFRVKGEPGHDTPRYNVEVNDGPRTRYTVIGYTQKVGNKWNVCGDDSMTFNTKKFAVAAIKGAYLTTVADDAEEQQQHDERETALADAQATEDKWPANAKWPKGTMVKHKLACVLPLAFCHVGAKGTLRYGIDVGHGQVFGDDKDFTEVEVD